MSEIRDDRSKRFAQLIGLELKANFAREETSQAEVAEQLGHSKSGYSRWLSAKPSMPVEALLNTCELIGVDPRSVVDAAYQRLIEEMGQYNQDDIHDLASHPEMYDLAADTDPNKDAERDVEDYGA